MSFDELWSQVKGLPGTALLEIPSTLSETRKRKLIKKSHDEVSRIIGMVIAEINGGSVEKLDTLIQKKLKKSR